MSPQTSIMRRFSRSTSMRKNQNQQNSQSPTSYTGPNNALASPGGASAYSSHQQQQHQHQHQYQQQPTVGSAGNLRDRALGGDYTVLPSGRASNEGRPISSATDGSFDFANRPVSGTVNTNTMGSRISGGSLATGPRRTQSVGGGLSRTDQIVLQHFWESKYQENAKRDLHYLRFPAFPAVPGHKDLVPYCEIYHLIKTSPGATIISLGSADGVYIGFELQSGSQLHIDLDDDWFLPSPNTTTSTHQPLTGPTSITHNRLSFRPFSAVISHPDGPSIFRTWPKPLTIEFLEDQYQSWCRDLMSICWDAQEIRELGPSGNGAGQAGNAPVPAGSVASASGSGMNLPGVHHQQNPLGDRGSQGNADSVVDDGYASEPSAGQRI